MQIKTWNHENYKDIVQVYDTLNYHNQNVFIYETILDI